MARHCVFCGGTPLTGEHIFPSWVSSMLRIPNGKVLEIDTYVDQGGKFVSCPRRYSKAINEQVRRVCETCNNKWMSNLESKARPIITGIHSGSLTEISLSDQQVLAFWATKTATMLDFIHPRPVSPSYRCKWIYEHQQCPPSTVVWLARYDGDGAVTSRTKHIFLDPGEETPPDSPDAELYAFNLGTLMFVVVFVRIPNVRIKLRFFREFRQHLHKLWPPTSRIIEWPQRGVDTTFRRRLYNASKDELGFLIEPLNPR